MEENRHSVRLTDRKELSFTGILSVISFREDAVELESSLGFCQITGVGMHMEKLDLEAGEVVLTGRIISLYYPDEGEQTKKGILRRLFS